MLGFILDFRSFREMAMWKAIVLIVLAVLSVVEIAIGHPPLFDPGWDRLIRALVIASPFLFGLIWGFEWLRTATRKRRRRHRVDL